MNAINIMNLTKKFNSKTVIDNLNLEVKPNQVFGFLGKNGAGKSTLINILSGNVYKTSGSFSILDYSDNDISIIKKQIGVMPDVANLYTNMNAIEFLTYMAKLKGLNLTKNEIFKVLSQVKLENVHKVKIQNYSFGMKKKISLAQAILGKPKLIFLDEPTSGVDPESILAIHDLIKSLRDKGTTIFLTSHNLNEVEKLCTNIAILEKGKIKLQGNLEKLKEDFSKNINIKITYSCESKIDLSTLDDINLISISHNEINLEVKDKSKIPYIVNLLIENKANIYELNQNTVSLEDIFLN